MPGRWPTALRACARSPSCWHLCVFLPLPLPLCLSLPLCNSPPTRSTLPCKPTAPLSVGRQHANSRWRRESGTAAAQERRGGYAGAARRRRGSGTAAARERRSCGVSTFHSIRGRAGWSGLGCTARAELLKKRSTTQLVQWCCQLASHEGHRRPHQLRGRSCAHVARWLCLWAFTVVRRARSRC